MKKPVHSALWLVFLLPVSEALAAIPVIEDPGTLFADVVDVTTDLPIDLQMMATDNPTSWSASGLPGGFSIDSRCGLISGTSSSPLSSTFTVFASNADGTGSRSVTLNISERDADLPNPAADGDIENGVDITDPRFMPLIQDPGNGARFWQRFTSLGVGNDIIRTSSNLPHGSATGFRGYVRGPCTVTFNWRAASETGFDFLRFYIDGVQQEAISGITQFADVSRTLGPGLHELDWLYTKDGSVSSSLDTGFVDNVRITGYPEWAKARNLNPFNSDFAIDKEKDGNTLLTEYALGLSPSQSESVAPILTFQPDGRAVVEVSRNSSAIGVAVDLQQNTTFQPAGWTAGGLEILANTSSVLRKREVFSSSRNLFRIIVTSQ